MRLYWLLIECLINEIFDFTYIFVQNSSPRLRKRLCWLLEEYLVTKISKKIYRYKKKNKEFIQQFHVSNWAIYLYTSQKNCKYCILKNHLIERLQCRKFVAKYWYKIAIMLKYPSLKKLQWNIIIILQYNVIEIMQYRCNHLIMLHKYFYFTWLNCMCVYVRACVWSWRLISWKFINYWELALFLIILELLLD